MKRKAVLLFVILGIKTVSYSQDFVRSVGYALSSVRRPGGFAIRRQTMT